MNIVTENRGNRCPKETVLNILNNREMTLTHYIKIILNTYLNKKMYKYNGRLMFRVEERWNANVQFTLKPSASAITLNGAL